MKVLEFVRDGSLQLSDEYVRRHPSGNGVSARYFKQVLFISEVNGRISELRAKGDKMSEIVGALPFAASSLKGQTKKLSFISSMKMVLTNTALPSKKCSVYASTACRNLMGGSHAAKTLSQLPRCKKPSCGSMSAPVSESLAE